MMLNDQSHDFLEVPLFLSSLFLYTCFTCTIHSISVEQNPTTTCRAANSNGAAVMFVFVELMACNVYCDVVADDENEGEVEYVLWGLPPRMEIFLGLHILLSYYCGFLLLGIS